MALNDPIPEKELPKVAEEIKGKQSGTFRDVEYEPLTSFANRHRIPVSEVRRMNPDGVSDDGRITKPSLKVGD